VPPSVIGEPIIEYPLLLQMFGSKIVVVCSHYRVNSESGLRRRNFKLRNLLMPYHDNRSLPVLYVRRRVHRAHLLTIFRPWYCLCKIFTIDFVSLDID